MSSGVIRRVIAGAALLYVLLQSATLAQQDERLPILVSVPEFGPAVPIVSSSVQILQGYGFTRSDQTVFRTCDPPRTVIAGTMPASGIAKYRALLRQDATFAARVYDNPMASPKYGPVCARPRDLGEDNARSAAGLNVSELQNGKGVVLAIVDVGIDMKRILRRFPQVKQNTTFSLISGPAVYGDHGTQCAYIAALAAPAVEIADVRVTGDTHSFARAYEFLESTWKTHGKNWRALVVSTSWEFRKTTHGFNPDETLANPSHPLTAKVKCLSAAGIDVIFAAGNAGECGASPSATQGSIKPPNSESSVITIGAVDADRVRLADSGQGGSAALQKPDLSAFGSFMLRDMTSVRQTSMAAAFAAGMTAQLRSLDGWSATERTSQQVRKCFIDHADKNVQIAGPEGTLNTTTLTGHSNDFGYGVMRFDSVHTWKDECGK